MELSGRGPGDAERRRASFFVRIVVRSGTVAAERCFLLRAGTKVPLPIAVMQQAQVVLRRSTVQAVLFCQTLRE